MFWACQRTKCAHFHGNPSRIKNHLVESEKSFSAEKRKTIEITTTDTGKSHANVLHLKHHLKQFSRYKTPEKM